MSIETWRMERLETTPSEYERLKKAGFDTLGQIKEALQDGPQALADKSGLGLEAAKYIAEQIARFEKQEAAAQAKAAAEKAPKKAPETHPPAPDNGEDEELRRLPHTLEELQDYPKEIITPEIVANIMGCPAQNIRSQAQVDAGALGFPVIIVGKLVKIPRRGFIYFMEYGRTCVQHKS